MLYIGIAFRERSHDRSSFQPWSAWMSASCGRLGLWCSWSIPQFSKKALEKELENLASTCMSCATRRTFVSFLRVTMEAPVNRFPTRTEPRGSVAVAPRDLAAGETCSNSYRSLFRTPAANLVKRGKFLTSTTAPGTDQQTTLCPT